MIASIANLLGVSVLRLGIYAGLVALATGGALTIRQHYINLGWDKHKVAVEKQDASASSASKTVDQKVAKCQEGINGYWDVISQGCKLDEAVK